MKRNRVDIITLGCSKNLVDSERLLHQLKRNGFDVTHDSANPEGAICVINTCGFIGDAKEESVNTILEMCQRKSEGKLKRLYVMGCLSERYFEELSQEIPEVDKFYGKFDWNNLLDELGKVYVEEEKDERCLTTPSHYAYVKISEGCNRRCSYCAIPIITGKHVSRPIEDILQEVENLVHQGVKEIQVIAQELTYYGLDLYGKRCIAELIDRMACIEGLKWIRLHYAYPTDFPFELLQVMKKHDNVCKYLDIALQHISAPVLEAMHRNVTPEETRQLISRIREEVPGIHLRTTLMVGHPGETEQSFDELLEFVKWARFERMGAFAYSEEEGTYSALHYKDDIPVEVKEARLSKLMRVQQNISESIQEEKIGQVLDVVVDREEGDYYVGRTEFDSPEVDPEVLLQRSESSSLVIGNFYKVEITSSDSFDLYGKVISK